MFDTHSNVKSIFFNISNIQGLRAGIYFISQLQLDLTCHHQVIK